MSLWYQMKMTDQKYRRLFPKCPHCKWCSEWANCAMCNDTLRCVNCKLELKVDPQVYADREAYFKEREALVQ